MGFGIWATPASDVELTNGCAPRKAILKAKISQNTTLPD